MTDLEQATGVDKSDAKDDPKGFLTDSFVFMLFVGFIIGLIQAAAAIVGNPTENMTMKLKNWAVSLAESGQEQASVDLSGWDTGGN